MNNKGFMMAEVVVVASIVLVAMGGLYASYNKIISIYNQRINYYDVPTLYELGNYKLSGLPSLTKTSPVLNSSGKLIYYVTKDDLKEYKNNNNIFTVSNQTLKDYFNYLSTSLDFDSNGPYASVNRFLIMEKCIDQDNCKYAYLEVFDDEIAP